MANPTGLCKCGCGKKTWIPTETCRKRGYVKGQPVDYYKGHSQRGVPKSVECKRKLSLAKKGKPLSAAQREAVRRTRRFGERNHAYNGGLWIERRSGRCYIRCRDGTAVLYYRAVMECMLRRPLLKCELVHHVNGDPADDQPENLRLLPWGKHSSLTNKQYTREEMVQKLRDYKAQFNQKPTTTHWNKLRLLPNAKTYRVYFGSWAKAVGEAGL